MLQIPNAPNSIQKGFPLKMILDQKAVSQLAENLHFVYPEFDVPNFVKDAMNSIDELSITERSKHIAKSMNNYLPDNYSEAVAIILNSLTPPLEKTEGNGLAVLFYMPHCSFIANYGLDDFDDDVDVRDIADLLRINI